MVAVLAYAQANVSEAPNPRGTAREYPGLGSLDVDGNLRSTTDFRALYYSLLEQWLGHDAAPIIGGADRLDRYGLLRV